MLFPVVVYKDEDSCFGVTIPDIPGCFSAGDSLIGALVNVQDAVEAHLGDGEEIPVPSDMEKLISNPDYAGGVWVMVDIDFSFMEGKAVRVNITVPQNVLYNIDQYAREIGLTRSALLTYGAKIMMNIRIKEEILKILTITAPNIRKLELYDYIYDGIFMKKVKEDTPEISNQK